MGPKESGMTEQITWIEEIYNIKHSSNLHPVLYIFLLIIM